jgi:N6-adenosine-specific RNA methylase IME4
MSAVRERLPDRRYSETFDLEVGGLRWGFKYCTGRPWLKLWSKKDELILYPDSFAQGTGYEVRNSSELMIIAKRGRPQRLGGAKWHGHVIAPRREHSPKPDSVRDEIVKLFDGARCELFARSRHPGFDSWGDEVDRFVGGR